MEAKAAVKTRPMVRFHNFRLVEIMYKKGDTMRLRRDPNMTEGNRITAEVLHCLEESTA